MRLAAGSLCSRIGVTAWDETILAKALKRVPKVRPGGPWIAGGAVRRTIMKQDLESDFDFFFIEEAQKNEFVDELVNKFGAALKSQSKTNALYILPSRIVGEEEPKVYLPEMKIQVIHFRYFQSPEELIDSFDYTICQFAYNGEEVIMGDFSLWDAAKKVLIPHKLSFATSSLRRMLKYTKQGFTVCAGGLSNFLEQVVRDPASIHSDTLYID